MTWTINDLPLTQEELVNLLNTMTTGGTGPHPVNVYKRAATQPSTPTGDGTPAGWSLSPLAADGNPLWLSTSIQTALNTLIGSWSTPVRLDGTDGTNGIDGTDGVDGATGPPGLPGADGGYVDYVFVRTVIQPDAPTGDGTPPDDWYDAPPEDDGNPLWVSTAWRLANDTVVGSWSTPVRLDGEDGGYVDYVFKRAATQPAAPTGSGTPPTGWSDAPPEADGNPLWVSTAYRLADDTVVGSWSTPVQLTGDDGADGSPGDNVYIQYSANGSDWHDPPFVGATDLYMRTKIGSAGTWSSAIRIVGEDGVNGTDGTDGADGDSIYIQYSANGSTGWHDPPFVSGTDLYMRTKIGVAGSWSPAIRIVGEKGDTGATGATEYYEGTDAAKTAVTPSSVGAFYRATDTGKLYAWTGVTWAFAAAIQFAALVGTLVAGQIITDSLTAKVVTADCIDTIAGRSIQVGATNDVQNENDVWLPPTTSGPSWRNVGGLKMEEKLNATSFRIKFTLDCTDYDTGAYINGQIYKNGVAFGTAKQLTGTYTEEFSEDFNGTLAEGDKIELYIQGEWEDGESAVSGGIIKLCYGQIGASLARTTSEI